MDAADLEPPTDLDALLDALDAADTELRALYRQLAENPDLASVHETRLKELHATRLDLAQRVGLASLQARRASRRDAPMIEAAPSEPSVIAEPEAISAAPTADEPEPPHAPASPHEPPASDAQLAEWKSAVRSGGLGSGLRPLSTTTAWPLILHDLRQALGPPRDVGQSVALLDEIDALDDVSTDERQQMWRKLPRPAQQLWLAMLVARIRVLRDLPLTTPEQKARIRSVFGRCPAYAKAYTPGHVNGMQLARHVPAHGSWGDDARHHWQALDDLLGEEHVVRARPAPSSSKKIDKPAPEDADAEPEIDPSWSLLPVVRGRHAIMVGGDPREQSRERLQHAFALAVLEWPEIGGPRKLDALVQRIRRGTYGLVLVLQPFVAHKDADPIIDAAKGSNTPWALVASYGVSAVRLGIERFLGGPDGPRAAGGTR